MLWATKKAALYLLCCILNGKEFAKKALVLKDHWFDRGY